MLGREILEAFNLVGEVLPMELNVRTNIVKEVATALLADMITFPEKLEESTRNY